MIIPKGRVVYENLNTSFTNLNELLAELQSEKHTGYMRVRYWDYEAVLYFDGGKIINGFEEQGGERIIGADAVSGLIEKVQEKDGTISVYQMPAETITLLASTIRGEVVHKDLSSEFTNLSRLIEKLRREALTGYVEVNIQDVDGAGMIFIQAGDPLTSVISINGETVTGPDVLQRIIETAANHNATFNVYKAELEAAIVDGAEVMAGLEMPLLLSVWEDVLSSTERVVAENIDAKAFRNTFKDVRLQNAEHYPFLDPFAAQFNYVDGKIEVQGASARQLNQGLSECLLETVRVLDEELTKTDLMQPIQDAMAFLTESRSVELERYGIPALLPGFFV
jgi:hypothetical protein